MQDSMQLENKCKNNLM